MSRFRRGLPPAPAGAVRVPADKHFRRPDSRVVRRRGWGFTWKRAVAFAVVIALAAGTVTWLVSRIVNASIFTVRTIDVRGNAHLSTGEIEALVSGIRQTSILRVDLNKYQRRLMDSPWVAKATLWRVLPSTVGIQIVERVPMALARQKDQLYLVDDLGTIIGEFGPEYQAFDLPIVDGLLPPAGEGSSTVDPARVQVTAQFLTAIAASPEFRSHVSQADVSDAHDVVALLDTDPTLLHLGDRQFVDRIRRYQELASALRDQFKTVDAVDLRFDDRVFVRKGR